MIEEVILASLPRKRGNQREPPNPCRNATHLAPLDRRLAPHAPGVDGARGAEVAPAGGALGDGAGVGSVSGGVGRSGVCRRPADGLPAGAARRGAGAAGPVVRDLPDALAGDADGHPGVPVVLAGGVPGGVGRRGAGQPGAAGDCGGGPADALSATILCRRAQRGSHRVAQEVSPGLADAGQPRRSRTTGRACATACRARWRPSRTNS